MAGQPLHNTGKPGKTGGSGKQPLWVTIAYVVGIALCVGSYVFTDATGYLIPGLTPFSLAAVIGVYAYRHYVENKSNKDGMLRPQMTILILMIVFTAFFGVLQLYAAIVTYLGRA